jgi:hypothetical protein
MTLSTAAERITVAVEKWTKPVTIGAGLVTLLWTLFLLPVAKRSQSLVTWIRSDSIIYPRKATSDRPLPLSYLGQPANSVRIVTVRIQNRGTAAIGAVDTLWALNFTAPSATHLSLIDSPTVNGPPIAMKASSNPAPNAIEVPLGLLDSRVSFDLRFLVVNSDPKRVPLEVAASLVGLPHEVTLSGPDDRLLERYFWPWAAPVLILLAVPVLPALAREWYLQTRWKRVLLFLPYLLLAAACLFLPAFLWAFGVAYLVSYFY